jgi:hypothetical protein
VQLTTSDSSHSSIAETRASRAWSIVGTWLRALHDQLLDARPADHVADVPERSGQQLARPRIHRTHPSHSLVAPGLIVYAPTGTADSLLARTPNTRQGSGALAWLTGAARIAAVARGA